MSLGKNSEAHFMLCISCGFAAFHLPLVANFIANNLLANYLLASSIATATATVIPTMGLLPAPMSPIIST